MMRVYVSVCSEISSRCWVGVEIDLNGEVQKCQNGVLDIDSENEVRMQRSQNFKWSYLEQFSMQNHNI